MQLSLRGRPGSGMDSSLRGRPGTWQGLRGRPGSGRDSEVAQGVAGTHHYEVAQGVEGTPRSPREWQGL